LSWCEEDLYGTDDHLVDTDGDGVPDPVEVRLWTEPCEDDMTADPDSDGRDSLTEIRQGTDPRSRDQAAQITYRLVPDADAPAGTLCLDFEVSRPALVPTLQREGASGPGVNDILVWSSAVYPDHRSIPRRYRVACVRFTHPAEDESQAGGSVELTDADFVSPESLDMGFGGGHCVVVE